MDTTKFNKGDTVKINENGKLWHATVGNYYTECNKCFGTGCTCGGIGTECICTGCECWQIQCFECDHKLKIDMVANKVWCRKTQGRCRIKIRCNWWKEIADVPLEKYFNKIVAWITIGLYKITGQGWNK